MVNPRSVFARRVAELEAENQKLRKRLQEAQVIIEFQKKVSDVLGIPLSSPENGGTP
jgi:cell shape-determining protein MreC